MDQAAWLLEEKYAVKNVVSDLVTAVLWNPKAVEATAHTALHCIKVWRDIDCIRVEIRRFEH